MEHYLQSSHDTPSGVYLGLKRSSVNGPTRITNSPTVSMSSITNNNVSRLFQYPQPSLHISPIYQNSQLFNNATNSNLNLTNKNSNLSLDKQEYLDRFQNTDYLINSSQNTYPALNVRRKPSLLHNASYANDFNLNSNPSFQYLNSLTERENPYLSRNKNLFSQHFPLNALSVAPTINNNGSINLLSNQVVPVSKIDQNFNSHPLNIVQTPQPLNLLQHTSPYNIDNDSSLNKRPRLFFESKAIQPLLIETTNTVEVKREPAYTPQVEAISPTPNEDLRQDSSPTKTTKDDILQYINQIDREITQCENQMSKLKKRQNELEASTNKLSSKSLDNNEYLESKQQTITQIIYTQNRKKSQDSQLLLDNYLGPKVILPLYNQPSDTKIYLQNKEKFLKFKNQLILHFKKKFLRKQKREKFLTDTYDNLMQEWLKKLENKDTNPMKKTKDNKLREFFEKQFPELRKQREDRERLSRAGQRVRSDADLEDIMDGIHEQELEDKKIRAYAVIPPILYDDSERLYRFKTMNCKINDPVSEHKELQLLNVWTDSEKQIFKEKFLQSPKNFGLIASYLERKSVMDCVQYYYSSKKRENYKQLLRKNAKKRTRALAKAQQQAAQQAAQQQEQQQQLQRTIALQARNAKQLELEKKIMKNNEKSDKTETNLESDFNKSNNKNVKSNEENCLKCINCNEKLISNNNNEIYVINKTNCFLYELSTEDIKPNSKLCKNCKIKFGTGQCPVPSCRTPNKQNRRLKTLPREWFELTPELRYTYSAELNFPLDCKRCCTQCWTRLVRKYSSSFKYFSFKKYLDCTWEDNDIEKLKNAIRKNGRNWDVIANFVGTKNAKQCKSFYFYFKYIFKLNELMKLTTFQTNDSDSDTCWNEILSDNEISEDEYLVERKPEIDKNIDPNLAKLQDFKKLSSSQLSLKSDCDSSATMSADEGQSNLENDLRITPPSYLNPPRSNSAITNISSLNYNDKNRPASSENLEIDLKYKNNAQTNQRYLDNLIAQQKQRIPSFLINPNAPTVPPSNHSKLLLKQDSPIPSMPQLPLVTISQILTPQIPQFSQPSTTEKPTCVRDLIYSTIDATFQSSKIDQSTYSQLNQVKDKQNIDSLNRVKTLSTYLQPEIKRETVLNKIKTNLTYSNDNSVINPQIVSSISRKDNIHLMPSFNLPIIPGNSLNIPLTQTCINEVENEVQDLSKKRSKKNNLDEYNQPKNYTLPKHNHLKDNSSIQKSTFNELNNLVNFSSSMPPPAHSNQLSRTSTPVLDNNILNTSVDQIRDMYLPNRHTESPRLIKNTYQSERITPNHLSPSSNSSTRCLSRSSNNSKVNIPPPPLLASNLLNNSTSLQFSPKLNNSTKPVHQGSITQGTPIHLGQQNANLQYPLNKEDLNYDGLLRTSPNLSQIPRDGSITLGTPSYHKIPSLNFLQNQTPYNLSGNVFSSNPQIINQTIKKTNYGSESQTSTQNQLMIDFNTSKQMQIRRTLVQENKERNSPLQLNRSNTSIPSSNFYQTNFSGSSPREFYTSSLIDAIITRSINQPDSNTKVQSSNKKDETFTKDKPFLSTQISYPQQAFNLGDHIKNMINTDYKPNLSSSEISTTQSIKLIQERNLLTNKTNQNEPLNESQSWKLRKVLEQKKQEEKNSKNKDKNVSQKINANIEPISPISKDANKSAKIVLPWSNNSQIESQNDNTLKLNQSQVPFNLSNESILCSFDYVQNRIVEVMKNSIDDNDNKDLDTNPKKKLKTSLEETSKFNLEDNLKKSDTFDSTTEKLPQSSLESITSLSELKAQKAEFLKQQHLKQSAKSQNEINKNEKKDQSDNKQNSKLINDTQKKSTNSSITNNIYEPLSDDE